MHQNQYLKPKGKMETLVDKVKSAWLVGMAVLAVGVIGAYNCKACADSKTDCCQQMECYSSPKFECRCMLAHKDAADQCVINDEGKEECCSCKCVYDGD